MYIKLLALPITLVFLSTEIYAAASSSSICRKRGGTWNQWSQKCTYKSKYKRSNSYKYKYNKKKSYSNYGSQSNRYKKSNSYNSNRYKKSYSNYGNSYNKSRSGSSYSNSRSTSSVNKKALAYCWQNKKRTKWTCDGPTQKLLTFWKTESKARSLVGCSSYTSSRSWSSGTLYKCNRTLKSYDRNIRGKYGISRNY